MMLDSFSNAYITYKIVTNNTFYICICVKKLSKIKIDKIQYKLNYVTRNWERLVN